MEDLLRVYHKLICKDPEYREAMCKQYTSMYKWAFIFNRDIEYLGYEHLFNALIGHCYATDDLYLDCKEKSRIRGIALHTDFDDKLEMDVYSIRGKSFYTVYTDYLSPVSDNWIVDRLIIPYLQFYFRYKYRDANYKHLLKLMAEIDKDCDFQSSYECNVGFRKCRIRDLENLYERMKADIEKRADSSLYDIVERHYAIVTDNIKTKADNEVIYTLENQQKLQSKDIDVHRAYQCLSVITQLECTPNIENLRHISMFSLDTLKNFMDALVIISKEILNDPFDLFDYDYINRIKKLSYNSSVFNVVECEKDISIDDLQIVGILSGSGEIIMKNKCNVRYKTVDNEQMKKVISRMRSLSIDFKVIHQGNKMCVKIEDDGEITYTSNLEFNIIKYSDIEGY